MLVECQIIIRLLYQTRNVVQDQKKTRMLFKTRKSLECCYILEDQNIAQDQKKTRMYSYREDDASWGEVDLVPWLEAGEAGQVEADLLTVLHPGLTIYNIRFTVVASCLHSKLM